MNAYVFGYGSLVAEGEVCHVAVLRSYRRVWGRRDEQTAGDVTSFVRGARGRVWAYLGSEGGMSRFQAGLAAGSLVVSRDYYDAVRAAVAAISPDEVPAVEESPPVLDLKRIEMPEGGLVE